MKRLIIICLTILLSALLTGICFSASSSSYSITGETLLNGGGSGASIQYDIRGSAIGQPFFMPVGGISSGSYISIVIPTVRSKVPGKPGIDTATAGNSQATVSFTAPASDGGAAILYYFVTSSNGITATGNSSPITVTGLTNGTPYVFTVAAVNSAGTGPVSAPSNIVTPQKASQSITFTPNAAYNFSTTPTLSAHATSDLPVTFTSVSQSVCTITSGGSVTFLTIGTCSINADQAGNASYLAAPQVNRSFTIAAVSPGAPTGVSAVAGNGKALVSFSAPVFTGGGPIVSYTVTSSTGATTTDIKSPITVNGLTNGTSYTFTVTANQASLSGPASANSNSVTPGALPVTAIDPPGGIIHTPASIPVTLSTTSGGTIYYSTNGNNPTNIYSGPLNIIGNVIVKFRTSGFGTSETVRSVNYSVKP